MVLPTWAILFPILPQSCWPRCGRTSVDFVQQKTTFRYFFFFFPYFAVQFCRTVNAPASRDFSTFLFSFFKGSNNTTAWDPGKRVGHLFQFR